MPRPPSAFGRLPPPRICPSAIGVAEVAFAVDDRFQGKGLGVDAARAAGGDRRARTASSGSRRRRSPTTRAMLEVFRDSGFEIRSKTRRGAVDLQLSLTPSAEGVRARGGARPRARPRRRCGRCWRRGPSRSSAPRATRRASDGRILDALRRRRLQRADLSGQSERRRSRRPAPAIDRPATLPPGIDLAIIAVPRARRPRRRRRMRRGRREVAGRDHGRLRRDRRRRARAAAAARRTCPRTTGCGWSDPTAWACSTPSPEVQLNASFSPILPPPGSVALLVPERRARDWRFSSSPRQRGVGPLDLRQRRQQGRRVGQRPARSTGRATRPPRVILLYLESFGNPRRFARLARRIGRTKPIVAVKAGRTRAGSRAAGSHTAALAASDVAVDALFQQSGVDPRRHDRRDVRHRRLPRGAAAARRAPRRDRHQRRRPRHSRGRRLRSGRARRSRSFPTRRATGSRAFLPPEASVANPVDMVASAGPDAYRRAIEIALDIDRRRRADRDLRAGRPAHVATILARRFGRASPPAGAPARPASRCSPASWPNPARPPPLDVDGETVPTYAFPENAARALGKVAAYAEWRSQPPALFWGFDDISPGDARDLCRDVLADRQRRLADRRGSPPRAERLRAAARAGAAGADRRRRRGARRGASGFPVVAKLQSRRLLHKTDVGAVRVGLASERDVRGAFRELSRSARPLMA